MEVEEDANPVNHNSSTADLNQGIEPSVADYYSRFKNPNPLKIQVFHGVNLEIGERYTVIETLGFSTYMATDNFASGDIVSIKKLDQALEHQYPMKKNLRELKILRMLNHENVIDIKNILLPKSREEFKDIYICSTRMETNLYRIIRSQQPLTGEHCQFFIYQILRGLKYIHSAGVIHFALKPENILINSNCDIRINNFYVSKFSHIKDRLYEGISDDFNYPVSYMPLEILLGINNFDPAVDVWSAGCILAELINRRPLFPGTGALKHQCELIYDILGTPSEDLIQSFSKPHLTKHLKSLQPKQPKDFDTLFPKDTNPLVIDLIKKMLALDWRERITVEEALQHPYLKDLHYAYDEPIRDLLPAVEFDYENYKLSVEQWKDLFYEEVLLYHFEDFKKEFEKKVKEGQSTSERIRGNALEKNGYDSD